VGTFLRHSVVLLFKGLYKLHLHLHLHSNWFISWTSHLTKCTFLPALSRHYPQQLPFEFCQSHYVVNSSVLRRARLRNWRTGHDPFHARLV